MGKNVKFAKVVRDFLVYITSTATPGPVHFSEKIPFSFPWRKEAGAETNYLPQSSAEVSNKWRNISTVVYGSKAWTRTALLYSPLKNYLLSCVFSIIYSFTLQITMQVS